MLLTAVLIARFAAAQDVLVRATPEYPPAAIRDRVTGTVIVALDVDIEGMPSNARVVTGLREDVDNAAIAAALKLRFAPPDAAMTLQYGFTFALSVGDEQGQAVAGSATFHVSDSGGLDVPGVKITLTSPNGTFSYTTSAGGTARADFLAGGAWTVLVEHPNFAPATSEIVVSAGETRDVHLSLTPRGPDETVVVIGLRQRWRDVARAERKPDPQPLTGVYELTRRDVESTPGALEDVTRAVHKLPGVASDGDMLGAFAVRGASPGETVFTLDRVPLDNPFHLAGFNSIFNPDLIAGVTFFASAPPAEEIDTSSAVMNVRSWDGAPKDDRADIDGSIDVSMSSARAMVQGPIGKEFSFAVAGRRSYLEAYFGAMKALDLLDTAVAAPEYSEIGARACWRHGDHKLLLTLLNTGDSLALVDSDDDSSITIDGTFKLNDTLWLAALDHTVTFGAHTLESTLAFTYDESHLERDFAGAVTRDVGREQYFGRTDADIVLGKGHGLGVGVAGQLRRYTADGPVEDTRTVPTWAALPIADFGYDFVTLSPPELQPQFAGYAEHTWTGAVRTRLGERTTWVGRTNEVLLSPSAGVSIPLPTATIPKISAGLYHHVDEDPLHIDPKLGNPDLQAERSWQVVVGADQGLPLWDGGMIRLEGYYSYLDRLVVNPDHETIGRPYTNDGTGFNAGVDLMAVAHSERLMLGVNGGYLHAERTNPLNNTFAATITPGHAQAWTAGATAEYQITPHWRASTRYDFHTGRPMSSVEAGGKDTVVLSGLNDTSLGNFHQVDLRVEWRTATARLRWSVYLEVLNAFYFQNDFLPIETVKDGKLEQSMLKHLPTRPFLGVRADF